MTSGSIMRRINGAIMWMLARLPLLFAFALVMIANLLAAIAVPSAANCATVASAPK